LDGFSSVCASKPLATVCEWFDLKTTWTIFTGLASKSVVTVSDGLTSKPAATVSDGLASKPTATVSWFGPQNQVGFGLSVAPQN
jgi:hypothetical protein